ncbi:hypothetical protein TNCV_4603711 [Trichonephila clavipes]|nr:hypothetical protein TNCV_4603711 [Trichonephila clavipes]
MRCLVERKQAKSGTILPAKILNIRSRVSHSVHLVTGSRVFSLTCPLGSLGPELMATLFQPNPRSEA